MQPERHSTRSRARAVAALLVAGALALGAGAAATPAAAVIPDEFNPFVAAGGYSVYGREDVTLNGSETEGSVAAGDTFRARGGSEYAIAHVVTGTGDYSVPVVDGDPTRLLIGAYDESSDGRVAITNAGTSDPEDLGVLKVTQPDDAFTFAGRGDFTRYRLAAAGEDTPPLIDIRAMPFTTVEAAEDATYTELPNVADYVEAEMTWTYDEAAQCLAEVADPATGIAAFPTIQELSGGRLVLTGLSADQPNVVEYQDLGVQQVEFAADGPQPGAQNPIVVRVPAGTTVVNAPFVDSGFERFMMYDLSEITGPITIQAANGRIDGSLYGPEADLSVFGSPAQGQILGRNVTTETGSGETHAYLFQGVLPCIAQDATRFEVTKSITGDAASAVLAEASFTVTVTVDGIAQSPLVVSPGVPAGMDVPIGATVVLAEPVLPEIDGVVWGSPAWSVDGEVLTPAADGSVSFVADGSATIEVGLANAAQLVPPAPTPSPTPAPTPSGLAESGADPGWALATAALLIAAGLGFRLRRGVRA